MKTNRISIAVILLILALSTQASSATLWTVASSLMPAWGLYPNGAEYGETGSLGDYAAWNAGSGSWPLTWVADIPSEGTYNVWVRRYAGYGNVSVSIDEKLVTGGKGRPNGGRYVWDHLGTASVSAGKHHIDILVEHCMFDAVLLSTDNDLQPETAKLPDPVRDPVTRALRTYRDDSGLLKMAGRKGFVAASVTPYEELLYDFVPAEKQLTSKIRLWGSPNQYIAGTFAVRALVGVKEFNVSVTDLVGPIKSKPIKEIDVRVVSVWDNKSSLFERFSAQKIPIPDMLLKDDRTGTPPKGRQGGFGGASCISSIPAHQSRQFWLTVHVPASYPAGIYKGKIQLGIAKSRIRSMTIPIEIEVLPIDLRMAEGYNSIYYIGRPGGTVSAYPGRKISVERYKAELADQVRHGLNTTTVYGSALLMHYLREAGMTKPPCLMYWPDTDQPKEVADAKALGFEDVLFYGVDEPNAPQEIERCRLEAVRRLNAGLHTFTAINNEVAQEALKDVINHPVYTIYRFDGKDNPAVMYARSKGFHPVSYALLGQSFPLHNRAMMGLYNKACGYEGSSPWAYYESTESDVYGSECFAHNVTYPDEFGNPIPTLRWEAYRDGIDDVRYLEALDRSIADAHSQLSKGNPPVGLEEAIDKAELVRKNRFESINNRWFQYICSLSPGDLDSIRREIADAVVKLNGCMK